MACVRCAVADALSVDGEAIFGGMRARNLAERISPGPTDDAAAIDRAECHV